MCVTFLLVSSDYRSRFYTQSRENERKRDKGEAGNAEAGATEDNGREIERGRRGEKREAERKALHDVFLRLAAGRRKLF